MGEQWWKMTVRMGLCLCIVGRAHNHGCLGVKYFFFFFLLSARPDRKIPFPPFSAVLLICSLTDPYQDLFGFGRSSDKLHSLGPKNVRRTSEETPKKLRSG